MKSREKTSRPSLKRNAFRVVFFSTVPFVLLLAVSHIVVILTTWNYTTQRMENSAIALQSAIEIQLDEYIRAYLRSKVETGVDILTTYIEEEGGPDEKDAVELLLKLPVGKDGYFYALDSKGIMVFHPDEALVGLDFSDTTPIKEQILSRYGYMEYMWRNTYEEELQEKALYMSYVPALDWIVTATSYRREFTTLIDVGAVRRIVLQNTLGETGYSYILDGNGGMVVHPFINALEDVRGSERKEEFKEIVRRLYEQKNGVARYRWASGPGDTVREKIVYLKYLPDFDWVVGTAMSRFEIIGRLMKLLVAEFVVVLAVALVLSFFVGRMNERIGKQIAMITETLDSGRSGRLDVRIESEGPEELVVISRHINFFIESLQEKTRELEELNDSLEDIVAERTEELTEASERLIESEKLALTSKLVAGVAHEIGTPLGIAVTAVSFAKDSLAKFPEGEGNPGATEESSVPGIPGIREAVDIAERNLKRAGELVTSFKNVSSEQMSLNKREFVLGDIVEDVLHSVKPMMKKKTIRVEKDVERLVLDSYPGVFVHMLVNFITNSFHHGFAGRNEGTIFLSARKEGGEAVFEYRDDGSGIDSDVAGTLFEPFVSTRHRDGNIGLGLNIVKNLVNEKLRGTVEASSTPEGGARFVVRFPLESDGS